MGISSILGGASSAVNYSVPLPAQTVTVADNGDLSHEEPTVIDRTNPVERVEDIVAEGEENAAPPTEVSTPQLGETSTDPILPAPTEGPIAVA